MDRRHFFKVSAAGIAGLSLSGGFSPLLARKSADGRYSIVILGDTHYDAADPEKYHAGYTDPNPKREALHRKEFTRNGNMWAGRCRQLVKRAACLVDEETKMPMRWTFSSPTLLRTCRS